MVSASTSRRNPVLLIHGMNGYPDNWKQSGLYTLLLDAGYTPQQIGLFSWGYAGMRYNNTGDLAEVAGHLPAAIAALQKQNGTDKIDLVTYSAGGLVARSYLATMAGAGRAHSIDRLVMIGAPNTGSFWMLPDHRAIIAERIRLAIAQANPNAVLNPVYQLLTRALAAVIEQWIAAIVEPLLSRGLGCLLGFGPTRSQLNSIAARQMQPGSPFLLVTNSTLPHDVNYAAIYGDIRLHLAHLSLADFTLPPVEILLGDLIVDVPSATGADLLQAQQQGFQTILGDGIPDPPAPVGDVVDAVGLVAKVLQHVAPPHNHGLLFVEQDAEAAVLHFLQSE